MMYPGFVCWVLHGAVSLSQNGSWDLLTPDLLRSNNDRIKKRRDLCGTSMTSSRCVISPHLSPARLAHSITINSRK